MPEGPEVFRMARHLRETITNYDCTSIMIAPVLRGGEYRILEPKKAVLKVVTKGKRMVIILEGGESILLAFALEGGLSYYEQDQTISTTAIAKMVFAPSSKTPGSPSKTVILSDPMHLAIAVFDKTEVIFATLLPQGFDPLHTTIGMREWIALCQEHPGQLVANFLINQNYVAGIGNRYRSEIMHAADIAPDARMRDLKIYDLEILAVSIGRVLSAASRGEYVYVVHGRKVAMPSGLPVVKAEVAKGVYVWTTATKDTSAPPPPPRGVSFDQAMASCHGGRVRTK